MSTSANAPEWFRRALATPGESHFVEIADCPIHYLRWGDKRAPGLLFVPGTGGHAHWFSHVAPFFADQFNVVSIDLSGCGDSGRRENYSLELIRAEIMGVCADAGMLAARTAPILAGHSIGGHSVVRTAIAHSEALLGIIAIDSLRYRRLPKDGIFRTIDGPMPPPRPQRVLTDLEGALARFRLTPESEVPIAADYLLDHIARQSLRPVEGGWAWKSDGAVTALITPGLELKDALAGLSCCAALIYGAHTHLADETVVEAMTAATQGEVPVLVMPGSGHYPMLDNPIAFVAAIKGIALAWIAADMRQRHRL